MHYVFKYRRRHRLFWKSHVVQGHSYDRIQNKMVLIFPNGTQLEIVRWSDCEVFFGIDAIGAIKKSMEAQSGMAVPLAPNIQDNAR